MGDRFVPKSNSLLTDRSWIRKRDDEDNDINRDQNYGKVLLSKSGETAVGSATGDVKTTTPTRTKTSVKDLTSRFSGIQDDTSSPYSSSRSTSASSRSTTTTRVTKNGTTETTVTTAKNSGSPTKTFTERVMSSRSQGPQYSAYSPTRTSKVSDAPITTNKDAESKLYDTLIPSGFKDPQSPTISSPTRTTKVNETALISNKDAESKLYDTLIPSGFKDPQSPTISSPTRTTKMNETALISNKGEEDKLYNTDISSVIKGVSSPTDRTQYSTHSTSRTTLTKRTDISKIGSENVTDIPSSIKDDFTTTDSTRIVSSTETVTVKSSPDSNPKTVTISVSADGPVDDLYSILLPKGITSPSSDIGTGITKTEIVTLESNRGGDYTPYSTSSTTRRTSRYSSFSDDIPSTRNTSYSVSTTPSYEYSSTSSSSAFSPSTYKSTSMSADILAGQLSSRESVHVTPERTVLEKDLCTSCRKPLNGDAKMVVDDMSIRCHATCFKCDVCNGTLGNLKAGDTLWIYRHMVHCENCFEVTRDKWRR